MFADQSDWPRELLQELNTLTRSHKFDWEKIAIHLVETNLYNHIRPEITPTTCRTKFAQFNSVEIVKVKETTTNATTEIEKSTQLSRSVLSPELQNMSIEELMATVEKNEKEMESKKEKIFQRVLDSLGEFEFAEGREPLADPAITAYREAKLKKQELERQQRIKQEELQEKERLEKERQALQRRFDPDSEDAIGDYPEFLHLSSSSFHDHGSSDAKPVFSHLPTTEAGEAQIVNSFSMQNFIHGEEFDRILTELEQELESQAMGKEPGTNYVCSRKEKRVICVFSLFYRRPFRIGRSLTFPRIYNIIR